MADSATEYLNDWRPQITTREVTPIPGWEPSAEAQARHISLGDQETTEIAGEELGAVSKRTRALIILGLIGVGILIMYMVRRG